jgi:hypothetical protein
MVISTSISNSFNFHSYFFDIRIALNGAAFASYTTNSPRSELGKLTVALTGT